MNEMVATFATYIIMPKTKKESLKVSPIPHHLMWFEVESESNPDSPNQVHLDDLDGNGQCRCLDFTMTCLGNIKKFPGRFIDYGEKGSPNPDRTRCRHIKCAIKYWGDKVLRAVAKELKS